MIKNPGWFLFLLILVSACSSSKWVVEDQFATDRNDFELLESVQFLERTGQITPQTPYVQFQLKAANTFEYAQRVKTDRYIQRYKPSMKSILWGLAGAGLASGSALLAESGSNTQNVLFGTAGFVSVASFLNMKPTGEPTPTGESRLLRKTGQITETDTVMASPLPGNTISYTIFDDGEILSIDNEIPFANNTYTISLLEIFNPETFDYSSDKVFKLEVYFNDQVYKVDIPIRSFLERFVVIESEITALRDEPVLDSRTILTDLARGSQLRLVEEQDLWFKVLYGISETFISKSDAGLIWRPSEFASQLSIITVPNVPFGNIDVENGLPVFAERNNARFAFILANREYQGDFSERSYAERDARLMEEYFRNSYGIPNENLQKTTNIETQQQLVLAYNRFANLLRNEQEQLVVYISGYVSAGPNNQMMLIGTGSEGAKNRISLNSFFSGISRLPVNELVIFLDVDNIDERNNTNLIKTLSHQILSNKPNSAIVVSSTETQRSRNYTGFSSDQKRHSIFTYFVADGMKKGAVSVSEIVNHLQRNVDYTSRRLHNQPQHILFFGKNDISLAN